MSKIKILKKCCSCDKYAKRTFEYFDKSQIIFNTKTINPFPKETEYMNRWIKNDSTKCDSCLLEDNLHFLGYYITVCGNYITVRKIEKLNKCSWKGTEHNIDVGGYNDEITKSFTDGVSSNYEPHNINPNQKLTFKNDEEIIDFMKQIITKIEQHNKEIKEILSSNYCPPILTK